MPWCGHIPADPECHRCHLLATDERYQKLWADSVRAATSGRKVGDRVPIPLCDFRGEFAGTVLCKQCNGHVELKLYKCSVHGACTVGKEVPDKACCQSCKDFRSGGEARLTIADVVRVAKGVPAVSVKGKNDRQCSEASEKMPVREMAELIRDAPPGPWPDGWAGWDNVRDAHIQLMHESIRECPPYPEGEFSGRGIVTCVSAKPGMSSGKNLPHGYFPAAWVMVQELRRLGCTLPVTFAYLGPLEFDPNLRRLVEPYGVFCMDLSELNEADPMRILAGWESKVFAVEKAPYEEVLFLDSDNIPVRDPTFLFDAGPYKQWGSAWWPDVPPYDRDQWLPPVVWKNVGLEYRDEIDFETGQFMVNKKKCWKELRLSRWINEHSDWFYRFVFGDKSTFHLAWAVSDTNWAITPYGPGGNQASLFQKDFRGDILFQHCTRLKPNLDGYGSPGHLIHRNECEAHLADLRGKWHGRLWWNDDPTSEEQKIVDTLLLKTFDYELGGRGSRPMRFVQDGRIGVGMDKLEVSWSVIGEFLVIHNIDYKPTCVLRRDDDGVWKGNWLEHERFAVRLWPRSEA